MDSSVLPLLLPPTGFYESFDALLEAAQSYAASAGGAKGAIVPDDDFVRIPAAQY